MSENLSYSEKWKDKLLAFLHDPPHKPFRIVGHEDARAPLLRYLGLTEDDLRNWEEKRRISNPDWQAAAADRFPFPRSDVLYVDWKEDGQLEFRHPLAGTRFVAPNQPRRGSGVGEAWVEEVLHGISASDIGWKEKFFRVWRLWPERCAREKNPILAYLVADTRIPDHTLWHHNGIVSALEVTGPKPAFLMFQIGPVQEFIAQARKMLDSWSGSYLLSFLISKALATVALRYGPDCIIYPNLRGVPLLDWWWSREPGLFPRESFKFGSGRLHPNELLVPSLPNRFLALVPSGPEGKAAAEAAEKAVKELWQEIAESVRTQIRDRLKEHLSNGKFSDWDKHWDHQVARFPVVDWVLHEWMPEATTVEWAKGKEKEEGVPPLFGGWENHPLRHAIAWREMIPQEHREFWHGSRNDAFVWALHYALTDWKFAAAKNARSFQPWPTFSPDPKARAKDDPSRKSKAPPKDHLTGREEVLGGSEHEAFWDALREAYGGADKGDFKGRQLYGAISVIKRLWPHAYLGEKLGWKQWKPQFESVQEIAAIESDLDAAPEQPLKSCGYYAVLCMDGDDMGQWVSGVKTPPLESVLAAKAWEYFKHGKDGKGGWNPTLVGNDANLPQGPREVRRPLSPGFHAALSEAISNFGLYCAGQIVEAFGGQVLYSGGDDVLAMLPAAHALECAYALQCAFRGQIPPECPDEIRKKLESLFEFSAPGFVTCKRGAGKEEKLRPNWPLMVPGPRATASVGIAIGHVRAPMQDTIQAARDAEKEAKRVPNKGAFCLKIIKRSGEAVGFAARWDSGVVKIWSELGEQVHDLSGRFAHRYAALVKALVVIGGSPTGAVYAKEWDETLQEAVAAELAHVLQRQGDLKPASARALAENWTTVLTKALSPRDYLHFWLTWAFVNRLAKAQPVTEDQ